MKLMKIMKKCFSSWPVLTPRSSRVWLIILLPIILIAGVRAAHRAEQTPSQDPSFRGGIELVTVDVGVFDIGLPLIDGYELARRVRRQPRLTGTRLFALTGYGQEGDRKRASEAGFDQHLTKPLDLRRLLSLLDEAPPPRLNGDPNPAPPAL